ncbi:hypothetical protein [Paludisphaera sp.]|uniref:hypothetical protein n=1 Tax=Paludisphaera sp. TaxID=2017432 RepID=UPI00301DAD51
MRWIIAAMLALAAGGPALADEPPAYRITLGERSGCATPHVEGRARTDDGTIDVTTDDPDTMVVHMTGTTAAMRLLGCTSMASERFQLVQDFEVRCSDPDVREVVLTLESAVVGYVSTARKAGARMKLADATVTPAGWDATSLSIAHAPIEAVGGQARQCNLHQAVTGPPTPLGRYTLVANFVLDATTDGGFHNSRAVADFSPDAELPAAWVAIKDPFQGASKEGFGFFVTITAEAPSDLAVQPSDPSIPPPIVIPSPFPPPLPPSPAVAPSPFGEAPSGAG